MYCATSLLSTARTGCLPLNLLPRPPRRLRHLEHHLHLPLADVTEIVLRNHHCGLFHALLHRVSAKAFSLAPSPQLIYAQ